MPVDRMILVDHHNYDLSYGTLKVDAPGRILKAVEGARIRHLLDTSHVVNCKPGEEAYVRFWLVDVSDGMRLGQPNFFLGGEPFTYTYRLGSRSIPSGFELWGQGSPDSLLNYWIWIKEQS